MLKTTAILLILVTMLIWPWSPTVARQKDKKPDKTTTQQSNDQNSRIQLRTDLVSLNVSVTDSANRLVTGLTKENFKIYEDKVEQEIKFFSSEDIPISLGIIFDVSGSMKEKISGSFVALKKFLKTSHDSDTMFLVTFNERAKLAVNWTSNPDHILNRLTFTETKGSTALYDAAYLGIEKASQEGPYPKKALLIISDGQDNNSRYTYQELKDRAREADTLIYVIGITLPNDELVRQGQEMLKAIAEMTGGRAFFPIFYENPLRKLNHNENELQEILSKIALELRHQYAIGYYPANPKRDGSWRKLRVEVKAPKGMGRLHVLTKEGYYAPKD